jgi:hypothetical protein
VEMTEQSTKERIKMGVNGWKLDGRSISLVGGRMIDGTGREPLNDSVVVVPSTTIKAVGAKSQVRLPVGSHIIDVSGKTVLLSRRRPWVKTARAAEARPLASQEEDTPWLLQCRPRANVSRHIRPHDYEARMPKGGRFNASG